MRKSILGVVVALGACAVAGGALAQQANAAGGRAFTGSGTVNSQGPTNGGFGNAFSSPNVGGLSGGFQDQAFKQWLTRAAGYAQSPQVDRANRLSILIEQGKCGEARRIADAEGDVLMAAKVPGVCQAVQKYGYY